MSTSTGSTLLTTSKLSASQKGIAPILIVLLIAAAIGGYFVYQNQTKPTPPPTTQSTPSSTASAVPTGTNETANWKTYTNTEYKYHLKYPSDWKVEEYNYVGPGGKNVKEVRFDSPNNYSLLFGLKSKNVDNAITGRTGVGAGDFVMNGVVKIGDIEVRVSQLVFENKIKEIYYSNKLGPGIFDLNGFDAIVEFSYRGTWNPQIDLKDLAELNIANQILSTFRFLP